MKGISAHEPNMLESLLAFIRPGILLVEHIHASRNSYMLWQLLASSSPLEWPTYRRGASDLHLVLLTQLHDLSKSEAQSAQASEIAIDTL